MKWVALIISCAAILAVCWVITGFLGKWFALVLIAIVFITMWGDSTRLRKLLQQHGIDPREGVKKK